MKSLNPGNRALKAFKDILKYEQLNRWGGEDGIFAFIYRKKRGGGGGVFSLTLIVAKNASGFFFKNPLLRNMELNKREESGEHVGYN